MISCIKKNMSPKTISRMLSNAELAEKRLADLKCKVQEIKTVKLEEKIKELTEENKALESKVESAKAELIKLETANGKKQYPIPSKEQEKKDSAIGAVIQESTKKVKDTVKPQKNKENPTEQGTANVIDIRKLDFRIGKIIDINKHPDADSLYVEQVDCGEAKPRTVVSGLVKYIPIEELRNRMVMVLCNLKPVKMRGITSEAMVMCASTSEKVEVLIPPVAAAPGDLVHCEGFPREPESILNPKKKIFETCAPDLMTNNDKVACYKGSPLVVPGKGPLLAPTLKGVNVK